MDYQRVTPPEFASTHGLGDWRYLLGGIHAHFRAGSFPAATALAGAIAEAAEAAVHHPDIDIRYPDHVHVVFTTHAIGGVSTLDIELAHETSRLATEAGARSEPAQQQMLEIAIDTLDADRIRPFWAAVLGYREVHGNLVDPLRIGPAMWFQQLEEPLTNRNRFHLDVTVPDEIAESRVASALAAGGTLVTDRYAKSWWVLADADGNEACICTWQDR